LGEHSAWYIGTRQDTIPTPRPAKKRPTTNRGTVIAAVCIATPAQKTRQAAMIPIRRPRRSAIGAARSAPRKVPAERIETIKDSVGVDMTYFDWELS
jgi:hypothetical protein